MCSSDLKTVFNLAIKADAFLFLEEDYTVAKNIYENILTASDLLLNGVDKDDLFGITLDPTDGNAAPDKSSFVDGWFVRGFVSGPMVLTRNIWNKIQTNAKEFCQYDDYNWDWSLVHMMNVNLIPGFVITSTKILVKHIGYDGMHGGSINVAKRKRMEESTLPTEFHGTSYFPLVKGATPLRKPKAFGGWGHPMDQNHCMDTLTGTVTKH